jgi:hypothetical protein
MTEHTPGPWYVLWDWIDPETFDTLVVAPDWGPECVAVVTTYTRDPECDAQGKANARLIAAAPDLLAALEGVQRLLGGDLRDALSELTVRDYLLGGGETTGIIAAIGAAIAKARGEGETPLRLLISEHETLTPEAEKRVKMINGVKVLDTRV